MHIQHPLESTMKAIFWSICVPLSRGMRPGVKKACDCDPMTHSFILFGQAGWAELPHDSGLLPHDSYPISGGHEVAGSSPVAPINDPMTFWVAAEARSTWSERIAA